MRVAIAGDSAGEGLAEQLSEYLSDRYIVSNVSRSQTSQDRYYADLADRVASDVVQGKYDRAILVCGTGIGVSLAANKVPGIRAALCHDCYSAQRAMLSNNAQIITMGARVIGVELAKMICDSYLREVFDVEGRSASNVEAIDRVDRKYNLDH